MDDRPESATIVQQFIGIVNHRNGAPPEAASSGQGVTALLQQPCLCGMTPLADACCLDAGTAVPFSFEAGCA